MPPPNPPLQCPKCRNPIEFAGSYGLLKMDRCTSCNGIWIGPMNLEPLSKMDGGAELLHQLDPKVAHNSIRTFFPCPNCEGQQLYIHQVSSLEIDWCCHCRGIFFDKGELYQLVKTSRTAKKDGGTDKESAPSWAHSFFDALAAIGEVLSFIP